MGGIRSSRGPSPLALGLFPWSMDFAALVSMAMGCFELLLWFLTYSILSALPLCFLVCVRSMRVSMSGVLAG